MGYCGIPCMLMQFVVTMFESEIILNTLWLGRLYVGQIVLYVEFSINSLFTLGEAVTSFCTADTTAELDSFGLSFQKRQM